MRSSTHVAGGSRGLKYIFKQIIVYSDGHNSDNQFVDGLINVLIIYSFGFNRKPAGLFIC